MLYRRLPNSDINRYKALMEAKDKKDNVAPSPLILSPETIARLDAMQPLMKEAMQKKHMALQAQSSILLPTMAAKKKTKQYISHFLQVFNLGVERKLFPAECRSYYQLDINSNRVPRLNDEATILLWAENLIGGEAARVSAGGVPMGFPSINEVEAVYHDYLTKFNTKSSKKDAYDRAQEVVEKMRKEVDDLILRIWDEVEAAYKYEELPSIRRKARAWGVVYVARKGKKQQQETTENGL